MMGYVLALVDIVFILLLGDRIADAIVPEQDYHLGYVWLISCTGILSVVLLALMDLYRLPQDADWYHWLRKFMLSWLMIGVCVLFILWSFKLNESYSRLWLGYWLTTSLIVTLFTRLLAYRLLLLFYRYGYNKQKVAIVGAGRLGQAIGTSLQKESAYGFELVAFFDDNTEKWQQHYEGISVYPATELAQWVAEHHVNEVWFAMPLRAEERLLSLLHALRHNTVNIRYVPNLTSLRLLNHAPRKVLGFSMLDLSVSPMSDPISRLLKSVEDKVLASLILVLISPLLLLISIAIKMTSSGTVFFRQTRLGIDGKTFEVLKFRSMVVHQELQGQVIQATVTDSRITPLGKWLRKTSLDELPQFINVLKGDMSIVGPRPHAVAHNDYYKDHVDSYMRRHKVKPGITGWAQVHGWRGETDTLEKMEKRVEYDLWYIEHWSLWLDLSIIVMTIFKGFVHENAR
jgi:putative colanic acid biosynthesis UDP-glucose lipid carrier transferase